MTAYDVWHLIRWFNMVLSLVAIAGVMFETRVYWKPVYCNKERVTLIALGVTSFVLGYTAFENNLQHNSGGPRVVFQTVALALIIARNVMELQRVQIDTSAGTFHDWLIEDEEHDDSV